MIENKTILIHVQDYLAEDTLLMHYQELLNMPLGILYLGSYLDSHGYNIGLLDTRLYKKDDFFKILQHELNNCVLVGLSVMTPCISNALEITKFIKNVNPSIKIVWGGIHATLFPESTVLGSYIDFVIVKEGEKGLFGLVKYLVNKDVKVSAIPNLVFKENGNLVKNSIENGVDLTSRGLPNYELLEMHRYVNRSIRPGCIRRQVEVLTSRGCPHQCTFCINTTVYKNKWRRETLKQTMDNLDYLIKRYDARHIFFVDEDFFCSRRGMKELVGQLANKNITWESNCRADYINSNYIDDSFLTLIKKSGCVKLKFGLESGSQRILDLLNKKITTEQSINAIRKLTRHKIIPTGSFMMGMPGETINDIVKTADLILKLFTINPAIDLIGPLIFRPYPGSELFRECQRRGLVVPDTLDEWSDFYIHNKLEEYKKGLPWFHHVHIFVKIWLFLGYLRRKPKRGLLALLIRYVIKFHILTKLRFIHIDYSIYRFLKKIGWGLK